MHALRWPDVRDDVAADTLSTAIGNTPLVRLRRFERRGSVEIYAKLEARNPGGSVKDRAALAMIREGERTGALRRGKVILDATSGNTGIAYAMIGASRGYPVQLCVPANVTAERKHLLEAYGASISLTDPMAGSDGAIVEARRIYSEAPDRFFYPDQYSNPANWQAHYRTTAPEIFRQTGGRVTHFVAGLGTSGTFTGTSRRLRELNPNVQLISVQPSSPLHGLEGLKHMASAIVPAIYDPALADDNLWIETEDAYDLVLRLAREEGVLAGPSSGAALAGALRVAESLTSGVIVTIFPDGGDRYLSEPFWNQNVVGAGHARPAGHAPAPMLTIRPSAIAAIRADGANGYPQEVCGAMFGKSAGTVDAVLSLQNISTEERRRRYLIGPDEYRAAERHADERGLRLIGFYHSHPDHPAQPSQTDLEQAWPNLSYVIVSVRQGQPAELRSWRLAADRTRFDEETIR
jgi:cysteine synthase B